MTRRGCAVPFVAAVVLLFLAGVWLNFAWAIERERAVSPDGEWIAIAYIDGSALTAANERVHVWRWWQPRFRWLGCQVLEAKNESPTRLVWLDDEKLRVQHGFRPYELIDLKSRCGPLRVLHQKAFEPYS